MIKYDDNGNEEWRKAIGSSVNDRINCITETQDGRYVIGGGFYSTIYLENGEPLNSNGTSDGILIKYTFIDRPEIEIKQAKTIGTSGSSNTIVNCALENKEGEYIVVGQFDSRNIDLGNNVILNNNGSTDGMIIKYRNDGKAELGKAVGGESSDSITCITETLDEGYIIGGYFNSSSIELENGEVLNNSGSTDGIIIKYDCEFNIEWGKAIGGSESEQINCIIRTQDGGCIVGGYFQSKSIDLCNGIILENNNLNDGMIIKYDADGNIEWGKTVEGSDNEEINCIIETQDGGYIVGGYFTSTSIELENGIIIKYDENGRVIWGKTTGTSAVNNIIEEKDGKNIAIDGNIVKYNINGNEEWRKTIEGSTITKVVKTKDEGYIIIGSFNVAKIDLGNGIVLKNNGNNDGMIVKYDSEWNVQWGKEVGGNSIDEVNSIVETKDGEYLVGGSFTSKSIDLGNEIILGKISSNYTGMMFKISAKMGAPEVQELVVKNTKKEFKIKTKVKEIEGTKGGSISGGENAVYEKVKYGNSSTKEIRITPEENYEIIKITVNGEEQQFMPNEDKTYTMPQFENITEDKEIEVTFALKSNKITINNVDAKTKERIVGAKYQLEKIQQEGETEECSIEIETNSQ